jgi:hypothetical protein
MKVKERKDIFIEVSEDMFEMKEYRTCYATVRKQSTNYDIKMNRDPQKYTVYLSLGPIIDNIDSAEQAKELAFKTIDNIMMRRYGFIK